MAEGETQKSFKKYFIYVGTAIVVIIVAGLGWYFYNQYQTAQSLLKNPSSAIAQKDKEILQKVGKLIELPAEQPTLAEVSDKNKLQNQPFFAHAENGDKVLIFPTAKKAVLYRPATNKIIEVGPVSIPHASASAETPVTSGTPSPSITQASNIAIYNGTTTAGLTTVAEKQLTEKSVPVMVILKDNAQKKPYEKTIVIDLSGTHKDVAATIAKTLGGSVTTLPDGETKPDPKDSEGKTAEILIILGKDFVK